MVYQRDGGQCTVDSAFGNVNREFLIKSSQELIHIRSYCARSIARDATLMRQSAEWGMNAFQSTIPRIKDRMKFEKRGECKVTLTVMILMYNLQARMVGINQMQSFYVGALYLYQDANDEFVPRLVNTGAFPYLICVCVSQTQIL